MGRATQGVTLISVDDGSHLSGVRRVAERDADVDVDVDESESGEQQDQNPSGDPALDAGAPDTAAE
jgi:DNA gyrase subunit A